MPVMRHSARITALLIWLLLLSTGAYATVQLGVAAPLPAAGPTGGAIDYAVAGIRYALSAADPSRITGVAFTLVPRSPGTEVATVRVKLVGASNSYFPCANIPPGSASWECAIGGVPVAAADQLTLDVDGSATLQKYVLWLPLTSNHR